MALSILALHPPGVPRKHPTIITALLSRKMDWDACFFEVCDDQDEMTSRLHARYLFSEEGGVRLDKGLQTSRSEVDVSFIDQSVHENLLRTFVRRNHPYKVISEFRCQL